MTDLPRHLDRETVEQYAREADTLFEFTQSCRVGRDKAKKLLHEYELKDEVDTAGRVLQDS